MPRRKVEQAGCPDVTSWGVRKREMMKSPWRALVLRWLLPGPCSLYQLWVGALLQPSCEGWWLSQQHRKTQSCVTGYVGLFPHPWQNIQDRPIRREKILGSGFQRAQPLQSGSIAQCHHEDETSCTTVRESCSPPRSQSVKSDPNQGMGSRDMPPLTCFLQAGPAS